jgi:electron transfer flavoprotein beta subunit
MKEGINNIVECIKQVPDPEGPPAAFEVDPERKRVTVSGISPVISPFDENALEAALRIKDAPKCRITAISVGNKLALPVMRRAQAAGADELILVQDECFNPDKMDSYSTAYSLAATIRKLGDYDLILTGRQAADWNAAQAGFGIAEILGIPSINLAKKITLEDDGVLVERLWGDGTGK